MFITLIIMAVANTNRTNHVFPLWLKADSFTVEDAATDITLPVDTSLLIFDIDGNTDNACTLPDGTIPGQIMTLWALAASGTNYATVTVSTPANADFDTIVLNAANETATLIWNGEAWALIAFQGATVS
jgi:hypothetical protein